MYKGGSAYIGFGDAIRIQSSYTAAVVGQRIPFVVITKSTAHRVMCIHSCHPVVFVQEPAHVQTRAVRLLRNCTEIPGLSYVGGVVFHATLVLNPMSVSSMP